MADDDILVCTADPATQTIKRNLLPAYLQPDSIGGGLANTATVVQTLDNMIPDRPSSSTAVSVTWLCWDNPGVKALAGDTWLQPPDPATPPPVAGSPTSVAAAGSSGEPYSVTLSWLAPTSTGGKTVSGYDVSRDTPAWTRGTTNGAGERQYVFNTGLDVGWPYRFAVRTVFTDGSKSPWVWSEPVTFAAPAALTFYDLAATNAAIDAANTITALNTALVTLGTAYGIEFKFWTTDPSGADAYAAGSSLWTNADIERARVVAKLSAREIVKYPAAFVASTDLTACNFVKDQLLFNGSVGIGYQGYAWQNEFWTIGPASILTSQSMREYAKGTFHHEFWHIIDNADDDGAGINLTTWAAANPPGFTYGMDWTQKIGGYPKGFADDYGTTNIREDSATIHEILMVRSTYEVTMDRIAADTSLAAKVNLHHAFLGGLYSAFGTTSYYEQINRPYTSDIEEEPEEEEEPPPPGTDIYWDLWSGTNGDGWGALWEEGSTGTGAVADIQSNTGRLRTGTLAGPSNPGNKVTRRLAVPVPKDFDAVFRFMNETPECFPSVVWRGDTRLEGLQMYEAPLGRDTFVGVLRYLNNAYTAVGTAGTFAKTTAGTWYWCRVLVSGGTHKVKMWGGALANEPLTGGVDGNGFLTQGVSETWESGSFGFVNAQGNTAGQTNFFVDDLEIVAGAAAGPLIPPDTVKNFGAVATSTTSINTSWSAATVPSGGGPVTGYKVYDGATHKVTTGPTELSAPLTWLNPGQTYNLAVKAVNKDGESPSFSNRVAVTLAAVESVVPNTVTGFTASAASPTSIAASWSAGTVPAGGTTVTGYRIYNGSTLLHSVGNVLSATITGLAANTSYSLAVKAVNSVGESAAYSTRVLVTTPTSDGGTSPTVVASETWTGTNGAGWGSQWAVGIPGTGTVTDIQNNAGRMRTGTAAGSYASENKLTRKLATSPPNNFDAVFRFMNEAAECYPAVAWRGDTQLDGNAHYAVPLTLSSEVRITKATNYSATTVGTAGTFAHTTAGTWYWCRIRVEGGVHKVKMWGGTLANEPLTGGVDGAGFQAQGTDTTYASGFFGFSLLPGGSGQANFYVDDLTITSLTSGGGSNPSPPSTGLKIIGMSSPDTDWALRLSQVGATGITARRIFAQLNSSASDQMDLVEYAHNNNMMPVFSFKVPSIATALAGGYDSWVQQLGTRLASYGKMTTVTFHHEPNPDMSGADFVALNRRYSPLLRSANVKFGPFLNGWLLDRQAGLSGQTQTDLFSTFTSSDLLESGWDWFGIDTYEEGEIDAPGEAKPASRVPLLDQWLTLKGQPNKPVGIGEYNGYSGTTIAAAGEAFLAWDQLWFACMWNATTGKGYVLEGARLDAFKATKADPRVRTTTGVVVGGGSDPLAALARVPWEGGPSYYSQFSRTAGTEWTSDSFFPIGYWGAYVNEQSKIQTYDTLGINLIWSAYALHASSAQWLRESGLWYLGGNGLAGVGSEYVGNLYEDEIDMWAGPGWNAYNPASGVGFGSQPDGTNNGYSFMHWQEASLPDDGSIRWWNCGKGILMWESLAQADVFINGGGTDTRLGGTKTWPLHMVTGDLYFYTDTNIGNEAQNFHGLPAGQVRRAGNYGEQNMVRLRQIDGMRGSRMPLGNVIELGGQGANNGQDMTPDKIEGATWSSLIHEARCISYFSHAFTESAGNPWSSNVLADNQAEYAGHRARVQQINTRVLELAPVLNTQSYVWSFNSGVATMLKARNGYAYIFAMQKVAATTSGTFTFTLPAGMPTSGTVEVMYENRTRPISGGTFSDSFAAEYTHHIYRIPLA